MLWLLISLSFEIFDLGPSWMMNYFVWESCWFGHYLVWKQDVCCPFVSKLKIDHVVWCVCWLVTHVFALQLSELLKDPYFKWAHLCHFSIIQCDQSGYGCTQSWFGKSIGRVGQVKHWILVWFCLMSCQSSWFFDTRTHTSLLLLVCNLELAPKLYLNHWVGVFVVQF